MTCCTLLDWPKPVSSGLSTVFHPGGYLRPKGHFTALCKKILYNEERKKEGGSKKCNVKLVLTYVSMEGTSQPMHSCIMSVKMGRGNHGGDMHPYTWL
jgi:hypothetical protein